MSCRKKGRDLLGAHNKTTSCVPAEKKVTFNNDFDLNKS